MPGHPGQEHCFYQWEESMRYSYHGRIKQRIRNKELKGWYIEDNYPKIGRALVLMFFTEPFERPIRPYRWDEYKPLLMDWYLSINRLESE